jgi:hypothetical protein
MAIPRMKSSSISRLDAGPLDGIKDASTQPRREAAAGKKNELAQYRPEQELLVPIHDLRLIPAVCSDGKRWYKMSPRASAM